MHSLIIDIGSIVWYLKYTHIPSLVFSVPYPPENITIENLTSTCMDIKVNPPSNGLFDTFYIKLESNKDQNTIKRTIKSVDHICGLRAGYTYNVSVFTIFQELQSSPETQSIFTGK